MSSSRSLFSVARPLIRSSSNPSRPTLSSAVPRALTTSVPSRNISAPSRFAIQSSPSSISRSISSSRISRSAFSDANIYADDGPPPVGVKTVSSSEIELLDGLVLTSPCIFLEGRVFLWEVPPVPSSHGSWPGWSEDHFKVFEVVIPRPDILLLGTGDAAMMPPPSLRKYLNDLGIQLDVMNSWNASSTYNMLAEEGRRVACALIPQNHKSWQSSTGSSS